MDILLVVLYYIIVGILNRYLPHYRMLILERRTSRLRLMPVYVKGILRTIELRLPNRYLFK